MTQTRRGFFGRIAALFAAPVVEKLPAADDTIYSESPEVIGQRLGDAAFELHRVVYQGGGGYSLCPFEFKSDPCGIRPDAIGSCSGTFENCQENGQTMNFGGMPQMPQW